jgi:hypothetical protein
MISSTKQAAQTRATGALLWYHLFGNGIDQTINLRWHPRFAILPLPYGPDTSPFNIQCSSLPHCFDTQTLLFQREITRTQQRLSIFPMGFRLLWNPASKGNAWIPIDDLLFDDVEHQEAQAGHTVCGITTQSAFQHTLLVHLLELRNTHKTSRISPQKSSEEGRRRTKRSSPQIPHNAVHIHRKTSYRLPPPWRYV